MSSMEKLCVIRRVSERGRDLHKSECVDDMSACLDERHRSLGRFDAEWNDIFELISMTDCCEFEEFLIYRQTLFYQFDNKCKIDKSREASWLFYCGWKALQHFDGWYMDRVNRDLEIGEYGEMCDEFENWVKKKEFEYFNLQHANELLGETENGIICEMFPVDCCVIDSDDLDFAENSDDLDFSDELNGLFQVDSAND